MPSSLSLFFSSCHVSINTWWINKFHIGQVSVSNCSVSQSVCKKQFVSQVCVCVCVCVCVRRWRSGLTETLWIKWVNFFSLFSASRSITSKLFILLSSRTFSIKLRRFEQSVQRNIRWRCLSSSSSSGFEDGLHSLRRHTRLSGRSFVSQRKLWHVVLRGDRGVNQRHEGNLLLYRERVEFLTTPSG